MFVELAAIGTISLGYNRWKNRDIHYIKKEVNKIFIQNKLDYYTIIEIRRSIPWGYTVIISLNGKGFENLEGVKDNIETSLGHETFIEQNKNLKTATIKIIVIPVDENTKYKPVKTKPWEIYCGLDNTMKELIVDLRKFPHVLVSGQTGCGKTELIRLFITNLISNYTDRDINLYFSDLSDMCDFSIFKDCKQTKGYVKNIEDSLKLFDYLSHIYSKRLQIFENNNCKNIQEYNDRFYKKRMTYNYIILDEFADYFPISKLESDYEQKVVCYNYLRNFARKMRKVGMFLCPALQRPDTTVLDPNLRSCLCTKIGFSQNSDASSKTVCDTTVLTNIENRKALLMYGNKKEWLKTLYIDDKIIEQYIESSIVKDRVKMNDYNKFLSQETSVEDSKSKKQESPKSKKKNSKVTKISDIAAIAKEKIDKNKKKNINNKENECDKVIPYKVRLKK